jgi:hypothetical protein
VYDLPKLLSESTFLSATYTSIKFLYTTKILS